MATCRSGKQRFSDFSPSIKSEKRQNTAALQNVAVIRNANSLAFWSAAVLRRLGIACHSTTGTNSSLTLNPSVLNR
jgi:hypothetical protein